MKYYLITAMLSITSLSKAQRFVLGNQLTPGSNEFNLISISSTTGVRTYRYIKQIQDQMFDRKIDEILVGIKNGQIVTTIYNLVPKSDDIGVPSSIIELIQSNLPYPL
jgi:hypothetical protein